VIFFLNTAGDFQFANTLFWGQHHKIFSVKFCHLQMLGYSRHEQHRSVEYRYSYIKFYCTGPWTTPNSLNISKYISNKVFKMLFLQEWAESVSNEWQCDQEKHWTLWSLCSSICDTATNNFITTMFPRLTRGIFRRNKLERLSLGDGTFCRA